VGFVQPESLEVLQYSYPLQFLHHRCTPSVELDWNLWSNNYSNLKHKFLVTFFVILVPVYLSLTNRLFGSLLFNIPYWTAYVRAWRVSKQWRMESKHGIPGLSGCTVPVLPWKDNESTIFLAQDSLLWPRFEPVTSEIQPSIFSVTIKYSVTNFSWC
jgi:hypothetical protein